jgi:periodic tryptophan protein 1
MNKKLYKDIESMQWHPTQEHSLVVTTESGHLIGFDSRNFTQPVYSVQAHAKQCSAASFSPHISGMLATVGSDSICKVWDVTSTNTEGKAEPKLISKRDLKQGELFSVQFYSDIAWVLAAGGSKGEVAIWDTEESAEIKKHF